VRRLSRVKPARSSPERRRPRKESRHDDGEAIEGFAASRLDAEHGASRHHGAQPSLSERLFEAVRG
jgi:hypothetical protein